MLTEDNSSPGIANASGFKITILRSNPDIVSGLE